MAHVYKKRLLLRVCVCVCVHACCTCNHIHLCQVSHSLHCHFQCSVCDFASNSTWYLAVALMTFSTDQWGLHVTPIRRNTPLYGKLLDKPQLLPANLGMNYWKGQSRAPWWGWHIWLAEWSKWHSLRKEEKGQRYLSSSERSCFNGFVWKPRGLITQPTAHPPQDDLHDTSYDTGGVTIKIQTAVLVAAIYQMQIKVSPVSKFKMWDHVAGRSDSSVTCAGNAPGKRLSSEDVGDICRL